MARNTKKKYYIAVPGEVEFPEVAFASKEDAIAVAQFIQKIDPCIGDISWYTDTAFNKSNFDALLAGL